MEGAKRIAMERVDIAILGGGAAGLATAIFAGRRMPGRRIVVLDGAIKLGAKILVAGGGRCNVTNRVVRPEDFCGGSRHVVKRVLSALSAPDTVAFFHELGVELHEEHHGKLFPNTNQARTVLDALLTEARRLGVELRTGQRVTGISRTGGGYVLRIGRHAAAHAAAGAELSLASRSVVLATGGRSLPKTGSDGGGYELAKALGHQIIPQTPALVPLVLSGDFAKRLSGISHPAALTVRATGEKPMRVAGDLLWTHFGVSGPVVLDASRHWHRARVEGRAVTVELNFLVEQSFAEAEAWLIELGATSPRTLVRNALAVRFPSRLASALVEASGIHAGVPLGQLSRDARRILVRHLTEFRLEVRDSRGYGYAEVTAGGVPLTEIDGRTMASRKTRGLFLVGEILDVDGRIGGFNFQWAWSSGYAAAAGLEKFLAGGVTRGE